MMKFTGFSLKHSKAVKYSGAGAKKTIRNSYKNKPNSMMKLSDHDIQLQEYRIIDIFNNPTYVYWFSSSIIVAFSKCI